MIILQCQEMIQESQKHLNFHVVPLHALVLIISKCILLFDDRHYTLKYIVL